MALGRLVGSVLAILFLPLAASAQTATSAAMFDIALAPYTPARCNAISVVWSKMRLGPHRPTDEGVRPHMDWFLGAGPDCLGTPRVPMPASVADQQKLAWLRTAAVAYEHCSAAPTHDACKPGGSAYALIEPLGLAKIKQDVIVKAMGGDVAAIVEYALELQSTNRDDVNSNRWYRKAITQGNVDAMFTLSRRLLAGFPTREESPQEAVRLLQDAAERGVAIAMHLLGERYQSGLGVPKDLSSARHWFQRAALAGNDQAMADLADYLRHGIGGPKNTSAATGWENRMGDYYRRTYVLPRTSAVSRSLDLGASHGTLTQLPPPVCDVVGKIRGVVYERFASSMTFNREMSYFYLTGCRTDVAFPISSADKDNAAFDWLRGEIVRALADPHSVVPATTPEIAACDMATSHPDDMRKPPNLRGRVAVNFSNSIAACEAAVRTSPDHTRTIYHLGRAHLAARDLGRALPLLNRAAAAGYPVALEELAILYRNGTGVPQDFARAGELLERAAALEPSRPLFQLLRLLYLDREFKHHYRGSRLLFEAAGAKGDADAMVAAFSLAERGVGGPRDLAAARRWLERIAALTDAQQKSRSLWAMARLGYYHHVGQGGPVNIQLARTWYEKARAGGYAPDFLLNNIAALNEANRAPRRQTGGSSRGETGTTPDSWTGPNTYQPPPPNRTIIYECYGCNSLQEF